MQFGITVDRNFYDASGDRVDDSSSIRYFRRVEIFSSNLYYVKWITMNEYLWPISNICIIFYHVLLII